MNKYITTFMSVVLIAIGGPLMFCSCSTAGAYYKSQNGTELALGPTSFFGEQIAKEVDVETPTGAKIRVRGYASHNPDRKVTDAVKTGVITSIVTDGVVDQANITAGTVKHLDDNSTKEALGKIANEGKVIEGNNAVNLLKATPTE